MNGSSPPMINFDDRELLQGCSKLDHVPFFMLTFLSSPKAIAVNLHNYHSVDTEENAEKLRINYVQVTWQHNWSITTTYCLKFTRTLPKFHFLTHIKDDEDLQHDLMLLKASNQLILSVENCIKISHRVALNLKMLNKFQLSFSTVPCVVINSSSENGMKHAAR